MHGNLDRRPFWNLFELKTPNRVHAFLQKKLHSKRWLGIDDLYLTHRNDWNVVTTRDTKIFN